MKAAIQACDDVAGIDVGHAFQRLRAQPLQKQCPSMRIGSQQPRCAVTVPSAHHQVLVFGVPDLQNCGNPVGRQHRQYGCPGAAHHAAVGAQVPLVDQVVDLAHSVSSASHITGKSRTRTPVA